MQDEQKNHMDYGRAALFGDGCHPRRPMGGVLVLHLLNEEAARISPLQVGATAGGRHLEGLARGYEGGRCGCPVDLPELMHRMATADDPASALQTTP